MASQKRLLMVDDDPDNGEFVRRIAESLGIAVETHTAAEEFMEAFAKGDADVVILDLSMPKTDGVALLTQMAKQKARSKIYIMSGFDAGMRDAAFKLGRERGLNMSGVIPKPVRAAAIQSILAEAIKG